ncbi:hypothetical protein LIN78_12855 [Leeia sp. TBRC 13508]|uniref:Histidinol-phosphatase n=1 Tax=Leeia speluncae TaxID=2884804 RepID=A0ABS8D925_9NEIS|nr:inositol monophosphatase family protein [Leeia speluncae]MCB6184436.1 hypothetical protein [Leeia speluncae]
MKILDKDIEKDFFQMADAAKEISMRYFRQPLEVYDKPDLSPVTQADMQIEAWLSSYVKANFPEHNFFGEEFGFIDNGSEYTWVVDPIDRTKSFAAGMPTFATLIALLKNQQPIAGLVDFPVTNERFFSKKLGKTFLNGKQCHAKQNRDPAKAIAFTTSPEKYIGEKQLQVLSRIRQRSSYLRYCYDSYAFAGIALGTVDVVVECNIKPYDCLALVPIIEGAGGVISNWDGSPIDLHTKGNIIASSNMEIHRTFMECFSE